MVLTILDLLLRALMHEITTTGRSNSKLHYISSHNSPLESIIFADDLKTVLSLDEEIYVHSNTVLDV